MRQYVVHFWQGIPKHLKSLFEVAEVVYLICICDSIKYMVRLLYMFFVMKDTYKFTSIVIFRSILVSECFGIQSIRQDFICISTWREFIVPRPQCSLSKFKVFLRYFNFMIILCLSEIFIFQYKFPYLGKKMAQFFRQRRTAR